MRILEKSSTCLRLGKRSWLIWSLCFMIVIASCLYMLVVAGPEVWRDGNHVNGAANILFGCLLLPMMMGICVATIAHVFRDVEYHFDRRSGELRIVEHRWLRRSVQRALFLLEDIAGVSVVHGTEYSPSSDYNYDYDLELDTWNVELQMRSGETLAVYKETERGGEDSERLAEAISRFLGLQVTRS